MKFNYIAVTKSGFRVNGSVESTSENEVLRMIKSNGYLPVSIERDIESEAKFEILSKKVKKKDLAVFCRQFYTMLDAGINIVNSLDILSAQTENKTLKKAISDVAENVQKGVTLSEAMKMHPKVFPTILINMVEAGEVSGNLDTILERMAVHFEKENKTENKVRSSMVYPIVLMIVSVVVVIFMLIFILPTFVGMFEGSDTPLPLPTQILIGLSDFLQSYWYIFIGIVALLVFGITSYINSENGRRLYDGIKLKLPIIKGTTAKIVTSRFTRTLSTLMSSGIPLLRSMEVVSRVVNNKVVEDKLISGIEDIRRGVPLSRMIKDIEIFPPMVDSMVKIGEESGALDDILLKTADFYDEEVDVALTRLTSMLEPLMIVFMALIIGFIVIAMYLPMFEVINTI
ncbi:type II secretion system F family protein [Soehngenia longivitae]|uniref:Type II secretion system F family protein n=1 Tax=Soehngenia longivitae TaxID=2562294 RepID=A0A4Z0D712_9FIRM|nr:type II secretion system F family protein [Soehngenia longivitae]TFZ40678.1 type II secretion system F family protein [Soehngenia longivitae]